MTAAVLVFVMAVVTFLLRALPFLVFRGETPAYVSYLGEVLPPAIIGMLVIYCLKDVQWTASSFGLPELMTRQLAPTSQTGWRRRPGVSA